MHSQSSAPPAPPPSGGYAAARALIENLRVLIDRRYTTPSLRESSWRFFLAQAGDWATEEGLARPGAYDALKPLCDRVASTIGQRTVTNIPAVPRSRR